MTHYVALLRAVNVGGTGKISMAELRSACEGIGLDNVRTYIASGNLIFESKLKSSTLKKKIENELLAGFNLSTTVIIRTHQELATVVKDNPFSQANPSHTLITFLATKPSKSTIESAKNRNDEEIFLGAKEVYVHYPNGVSRSKLTLDVAKTGTARNLNTTKKLTELSSSSH